MHGKGTLSATNLAAGHHLGCDLYLHHTYHGSETKGEEQHLPSELSKAQFARGNIWELALFKWLDDESLLLTVLSRPLEADEIREIIQFDERDHFFIAGLSFWPPKEALAAEFVKAGTQPVHFGLAKPDLIEITRDQDGFITWKVVDAKASQMVKTSHLVQIYFYTMCLLFLLPWPFRSLGKAGIWLPPPGDFLAVPPSLEMLKTIDLDLLSDSLRDFLFCRLPKILALPRERVKWHFNPLCRTCPFESDCRSRAIQEQTFGSMPNISLAEADTLSSLLAILHTSQANDMTDIEELHTLFKDLPRMGHLANTFPSTFRKAKRILGIPNRTNKQSVSVSPMVEAARTNNITVINRRNFTFPRSEDIAIVVSLIHDPASNKIAEYTLSVFSIIPTFPSFKPVGGEGAELVTALASVIRTVIMLRERFNPAPRTQFYVFSAAEHASLQRYLIDTALTLSLQQHSAYADVRLCIGALSEGAALLSTAFQPLVLSGALLDFLGKKGDRKKAELHICLERLGLSTDGVVDQLRVRITDEIDRLKREGGRTTDASSGMQLGQLPRVVVVAREVGRLLALPIPGFWDLPECAAALLSPNPQCMSDEHIYRDWVEGGRAQVRISLEKRNICIHKVVLNLRTRVASANTGRPELLLNEARVLSAEFMDICKQEHLRKLFFMQQFEVLARLTELWRSRIDGCPDAPILEYLHSRASRNAMVVNNFTLVSGALDIPADKDRAFYDYLLAEDHDDTITNGDDLDQCSVPVEALFDDLAVSGLVFPLNRYTKSKWDQQHPVVQRHIFIADLRDIHIQGRNTVITLQTCGSSNMKLVQGAHYRLSPRLVDFNLSKILSALLELDLRADDEQCDSPSHVPFVQLITDPRSLVFDHDYSVEIKAILRTEASIQGLFHELHNLGSEAAGALILKSSQRAAARRLLSQRLTVIWGPPGTGKTYTIALSLIRLFDVYNRLRQPHGKVVFLTAMTHAAIDACLTKFSELMARYRQIPNLPTSWLDNLKVEHVVKGADHLGPSRTYDYVYAGTVFQLYNFGKRRSFEVDCVVIDEAGQLSLSLAALVLRSLSPNGRIVVAGDSEQLAPILTAQYPRLKSRLFGSVLDCLMDLSNIKHDDGDVTSVSITRPPSPIGMTDLSQTSTIVQLTENFRLNPDLGEFVSTIYSRAFKPQKVQARHVATRLKSLILHEDSDIVTVQVQRILLALSDVMLRQPQHVLRPPRINAEESSVLIDISAMPHPISLALIRLQAVTRRSEQSGYEVHVRGEAAVAAAVVKSLRNCSPSEDIFVATPHRIQRQAVKAALTADNEVNLLDAMRQLDLAANTGKVIVDTVERLQGSEAAFVIALFSLPTNSSSASLSELSFLLERRRLNVAISRAKTLCILVTSDNVLRPSASVLSDEATAKGYAFLRAYEERAWSASVEIDLDAM